MGSVFDEDNRKPKAVPVEPPSDSGGKRRGRPPGSKNTTSYVKIEQGLQQMLMIPAMSMQAMGDQTCAWILVGDGSPGQQMVSSWVELAKTSAPVRKALEKMITGGAVGGVIMSTATVVLLMGAHHNVFPSDKINEYGNGMTQLLYAQAQVGDDD